MAEQEIEIDEKIQQIDQYSKIFGMFFAMAVYAFGLNLTNHALFNATIAAMAGIGFRMYMPYQASISNVTSAVPSDVHPDTPNYHHGAVGGALVVGSFGALAAMIANPDFLPAMGIGAAIGVGSYFVLQAALPDE